MSYSITSYYTKAILPNFVTLSILIFNFDFFFFFFLTSWPVLSLSRNDGVLHVGFFLVRNCYLRILLWKKHFVVLTINIASSERTRKWYNVLLIFSKLLQIQCYLLLKEAIVDHLHTSAARTLEP